MFNSIFWSGGPLLGFVAMLLFVMLLTIGTIGFFRRRPSNTVDDGSYAAKEMIMTSVATVNAVLLAFVIVVVWERYSTVRESVSAEAGALINLSRDAATLQEPLRSNMLGVMKQYADQVVHEDWPALASAGHRDINGLLRASGTLSTLWSMAADRKLEWNAVTENMMENLSDLSRERVHRFALAREGVTDTLWAVLLAATVATIVIGIARHRTDAVQQLPLFLFYSFFLGALLWLVADSDNPFGGTQAVDPLPFEHAARVIQAHQLHSKAQGEPS